MLAQVIIDRRQLNDVEKKEKERELAGLVTDARSELK
jgi:hypothetical protein